MGLYALELSLDRSGCLLMRCACVLLGVMACCSLGLVIICSLGLLLSASTGRSLSGCCVQNAPLLLLMVVLKSAGAAVIMRDGTRDRDCTTRERGGLRCGCCGCCRRAYYWVSV
jgi:hypothetical protein